MIDSNQLAEMQATLAASLPDSAAIKRATKAPDGIGGFKEVWQTMATVACMLAPSGREPEEREIAERLGAITLFTITLPSGTDVKPTDRITLTQAVTGANSDLEVQGVLAPRSYEISRRVACSEVS